MSRCLITDDINVGNLVKVVLSFFTMKLLFFPLCFTTQDTLRLFEYTYFSSYICLLILVSILPAKYQTHKPTVYYLALRKKSSLTSEFSLFANEMVEYLKNPRESVLKRKNGNLCPTTLSCSQREEVQKVEVK